MPGPSDLTWLRTHIGFGYQLDGYRSPDRVPVRALVPIAIWEALLAVVERARLLDDAPVQAELVKLGRSRPTKTPGPAKSVKKKRRTSHA